MGEDSHQSGHEQKDTRRDNGRRNKVKSLYGHQVKPRFPPPEGQLFLDCNLQHKEGNIRTEAPLTSHLPLSYSMSSGNSLSPHPLRHRSPPLPNCTPSPPLPAPSPLLESRTPSSFSGTRKFQILSHKLHTPDPGGGARFSSTSRDKQEKVVIMSTDSRTTCLRSNTSPPPFTSCVI